MTRFQLLAHHFRFVMTGNKPIGYNLSGISANTDYSVDALVDQRKKFNCIGLIPGKLMTGNNCICEHSYIHLDNLGHVRDRPSTQGPRSL